MHCFKVFASGAEHGAVGVEFEFEEVEGFAVAFLDEEGLIFHVDDVIDIFEWIFQDLWYEVVEVEGHLVEILWFYCFDSSIVFTVCCMFIL